MNTSSLNDTTATGVTPGWWRALGGVWRLTYRRFLAPTSLGILGGLLGLLALLAMTTSPNGA
jgi:hypothetical protein